jgi:hypothetical protein
MKKAPPKSGMNKFPFHSILGEGQGTFGCGIHDQRRFRKEVRRGNGSWLTTSTGLLSVGLGFEVIVRRYRHSRRCL